MQTKRKLFLWFLDMLVFEETRLLIELPKKLLTKKPTADLMPFSVLTSFSSSPGFEIREKYFEERSLLSLFRKVNPETVFDFLREIGLFYNI